MDIKQLELKRNKIILEKFFKLYLKGQKIAPRNYIDYFEADHFLITEIDKVRKETVEMVFSEINSRKYLHFNAKDNLEVFVDGYRHRIEEEKEIKKLISK